MIPQNTNLPGAADSYMAGLKVLNDGTFNSGDKEKVLEAIITQKWMAIFQMEMRVGLN